MEFLETLESAKTEDRFQLLGFDDYLKIILADPKITRNAFQRVHDMIVSHGTTQYKMWGRNYTHYVFFEDPFNIEKAIYGLDWNIMRFMDIMKAAANGYGQERRILLLVGPVGSSKSSMVDLLKIGLENYSKKEDGRLYGVVWYASKGADPALRRAIGISESEEEMECEMHGDPLSILRILYEDELVKSDPIKELNKHTKDHIVKAWCYPCPKCDDAFTRLLRYYNGKWRDVLNNHLRVRRIIISDKRRICIGTLQPKHEKDQDATELTGDVNYRAVSEFGKESDPRAFNFEGEFQKANRGIMEFIEGLKLDVAFLYDLLEASQSHRIKARKLGLMDIDEIIIAHTNPPDLVKLEKNELMLALKDRTTKIPIPYVIRLQDEMQIYLRDYGSGRIKNKHLAPHTIKVAAMWSVLTRLEPPKKQNMDLMQKMKLYNGQELEDWSLEVCKELREEHPNEGGKGISPRYIQDRFSNAVIKTDSNCVNPFLVLNEIEDGLPLHSSISAQEREDFKKLLELVKKEFDEIIQEEVQNAIIGDKGAIEKLFGNYIDNIKAFTRGEKVKNKYTGIDEEPNERLMRSIEEKVDVSEHKKDDFRGEIMEHIGALAMEGKRFGPDSNEKLHKALRKKLFEDQKDVIKLSALVETVTDKETREKIDEVKARLMRDHGYCEECARGTLGHVGGLFAKSEQSEKKKS